MTARALDEVIAIKYVAVSVVKDSDGAGVFSFVFHLRTSAGAVFSLSARYSVLRRLSFVIATEGLDAIPMSCSDFSTMSSRRLVHASLILDMLTIDFFASLLAVRRS